MAHVCVSDDIITVKESGENVIGGDLEVGLWDAVQGVKRALYIHVSSPGMALVPVHLFLRVQ